MMLKKIIDKQIVNLVKDSVLSDKLTFPVFCEKSKTVDDVNALIDSSINELEQAGFGNTNKSLVAVESVDSIHSISPETVIDEVCVSSKECMTTVSETDEVKGLASTAQKLDAFGGVHD